MAKNVTMKKRLYQLSVLSLTFMACVTVPAQQTAAPVANPTTPLIMAMQPPAAPAATPVAPATTAATATANAAPLPAIHKSKDGKLSFNFQDIAVKSLLQLIAVNSGNNFVISDAIKGNMSLLLQNVTWHKALDVVVHANGLDYRQFDNVMIIAPIEELASSDLKRLQAQQQLANLAPVTSKIIRLRFANATDLASVIKGQQNSLLSANGQIGTDPRTNTIWIRDNQESIEKVSSFINQLDIPAKQVLIEARIVSVDEQYAKELGVRWGYSNQRNLSGNLYAANQIRSGTDLTNITNPTGQIDPNQRLNFNMPANPGGVLGSQQAGSIGLALLHLGKGYLDLELSALEGSEHAQVVANPRVVTSNLQKATIQTGEEIPYQEATSSGATNVTFKKAVLSLEITPQITSDNNVVLNLTVNQDKRGIAVQTGPNTQIPSIDTQQVQSNVLLKNGETIVIGGVYKQSKSDTYERIPFFGALPVVGNLFRYKHEDTQRTELLIFVTPKIVDQTKISELSSSEKQMNKIGLDVDKNSSNYQFQVTKDEDKMHS